MDAEICATHNLVEKRQERKCGKERGKGTCMTGIAEENQEKLGKYREF